ncbi:beta strand repeat-containing protein [Vibrio cionasavignyae]|uniref:beta strand repeat-containing protein n=1 Tax=Vibrio cionasavignyae TaxID=2910252 RepID=UPI003D0DC8F4
MILKSFRYGNLKQSVYVVLVAILMLNGCFDTSETTDTSVKNVSHSQQIPINISNQTDTTSLSSLELSFVFDVTNASPDFSVQIRDVAGRDVAGYVDGAAYQQNVVLVPDAGIVPISLSVNNLTIGNSTNATMTIVVSGDDFFSNSQVYDLSDSSLSNQPWIEVVPKKNSDDLGAVYIEQIIAMSGNTTNSLVNVATAPKSETTIGGQILDGATAALTIPAGTSFLDKSGNAFVPIGDVTVSLMLLSADPNGIADESNNPLYLFPGGLSPKGVLGDLPDDVTSPDSLTFISAGFAAIEISDESGQRVSSFDGGQVTLTFDVPKTTTNPNTGLPLSLQDGVIPIWSYTSSTGKWQYEGNAAILQENAETFTVSKAITHLSYYNLDWYGQEKCKLEVDVVDKDGVANNQKLRLSFAKSGGGWAYKPSGWGDNPEKLDIYNVPAFAGHFDLLDSQGNSLLASIEVDGQVIEVQSGDEGLDLEDFCFGVSNNDTKSFKATLNIVNPPRFDIDTELSLVCPIDTSRSQAIDSGRYYLYSGYSYESSGEVTGNTISLTNLIENGLYRLYYYGGETWGQVEFTAVESMTEIQLMSLKLCEKIDQDISARLICLDDQQDVVRFKPAPEAYYWMYNRDYSQYLWGQTNTDGLAQEARAVDTIDYEGSAYIRYENRYYWGERRTVTASSTQAMVFDIPLPSSNEFCSEALPIDYAKTSVVAQTSSARADGVTSITLTVQERDQFSVARDTNTGTLTLSAEPSQGVSIANIQSVGDGTYTADITSVNAQAVVISGAIDGNALGGTASVLFTPVADISSSSLNANTQTLPANGTDVVTFTVQLKDLDGNNYLESEGDITFIIPQNVTQVSSVDNQDGTYTGTFSSTISGSYSIGASIGGVSISNSVDITFEADLDVSQSTVAVSSATVAADGTTASVVTVTLKDYAGNAYVPASGSVSLSLSGTAVSSAVQSQGGGVYTSSLTSTSGGAVTVTGQLGSTSLGSQVVTFVADLDVSQSTVVVSSATVAADGTTASVVTVTLKDYAGNAYVPSSDSVSLSLSGTAVSSAVQSQGGGVYTSNLTSISGGAVTVTGLLGSTSLGSQVVTFVADLDVSQSTVAVSSATVSADGTTASVVTVTLKDYAGNAYVPSSGSVSLSLSGTAVSSAVQSQGGGVYTSNLTSTTGGAVTVTGLLGSTSLGSQIVTFTSAFSLSNSTFTLSSNSVDADGTSTTVATIVLRDYANALFVPSSATVALAYSGSATVPATSHDGNGTFTSSISSSTAGTVNVTASFESQNIATLGITFVAVGPSASNSTVSVASDSMKTGTSTAVTVTLKQADGQDYGQSGGSLTLSSAPSGLAFSNETDNGDGTYTATVTGSTAGNYTITALVDSLSITNTAAVSFTEVDGAATSLSSNSISQDEGQTSNLTLTLRQSDNSVVGHGGHTVTVDGLVVQFGLVSMVSSDIGDGTYSLAVTCDNGFNGEQSFDVLVDGVTVDSVAITCNSI